MDLRYRAEKFGRGSGSCRSCRGKFGRGDLRLSAREYKDELWYHFNCFFAIQSPKSIDDIENYENLPVDDQEKIRQKIGNLQLPLIPNVNPTLKRPAPVESKIVLSDFNIEYSVSSRAECVGCRNKIMKGLIRVSKNEFFTEIGMKFGGQKFQHHAECFATICRKEYGFHLSFDKLPGFRQLAHDDQQKVMLMSPTNQVENIDGPSGEKKMKLGAGSSKDYDQDLENSIKIQTEKFQMVRELLKKHTDAKQLGEFLRQNDSDVVQGHDNILDRCADFISFGAIPKCTKCKSGNFVFSKHGYKCDGRLNEWANCDRFETSFQRQPVKFPNSMNLFREKLTSSRIKLVVQDCAVRPIQEKVPDSKRDVKVARKREPLYNMHIVAIGQFTVKRPQLKQKIQSLGGKLVSTLQEKIAFVIASEDEVEKLNKRMQQVKSLHIQVLDESFLDEVVGLSPEEVVERIKSSEISDWSNDPLSRIPQEDKSLFEESIFTRYAKKVENVKIKNGLAIDPDSGLSDVAHVYERDGILYTAVLAFVDIQQNKNSFYKIQALQSDNMRRYWVFTSWGRIGTKIGDKKLEQFSSAEMAVSEFENIYSKKTGNLFDPTADFKKVAGLYYPIDVDYENDSNLNDYSAIPSKLPASVQQLIKMIFDVDNMKQTMMEHGSKLSKESLTQLFEKVITHSRTLMHVAFVVLSLPTFKIFTMFMVWSLDLLAKVFGSNLVIESQSTAKLQSHESGFLVRIHRTNANTKSTFDTLQPKPYEDTIENRLKPEVPALFTCNPFETISKFRFSKEIKRNGYLSVCVYGCVAFAYMQFVILIVALNVSSTPPGLIFLSLSSFLIGYIIFKIFSMSKPKGNELTTPPKPTSPERFRISRSTTRRYLEFHEKTLSKIKLL